MPHSRIKGDEIVQRGEEWYVQHIQAQVETEANIGKFISIDIETGEYAVDADPVAAGLRVQAKHPDAAIYGKRIGYNAAFALGGTLVRTAN